eukprot:4385334-Prymnesium_polylepis.1
MAYLSAAIGSMGSLQKLDLATNRVGDSGMQAFASAVASGAMGALKGLYLLGNQIGDEGMISFANALKPTPSNPKGSLAKLDTLSLRNNQIGDA